MGYLLDANVFIEAKRRHYGFDFCPVFWGWLVHANEGGRAFSIERVGLELCAGADELAQWAEERGEGFFEVHRLKSGCTPIAGQYRGVIR